MAYEPRMRVFAGPNGSGKTTIIQEVRRTKVNGRPVDFGLYINADNIAKALLGRSGFDLAPYEVSTHPADLHQFAHRSGLLGKPFNEARFLRAHKWKGTCLTSVDHAVDDRLAQLVAQYLYDRLLDARRKFTFETVFSHPGKLDLMRRAKASGYKVYLYYVGTEDPSINVQRVRDIRVKEGGHDVPERKIRSRYERSMANLKEAMELAYHAFLWDNSGTESHLFCNHKKPEGAPEYWNFDETHIPIWFVQHYLLAYPEDSAKRALATAVLGRSGS